MVTPNKAYRKYGALTFPEAERVCATDGGRLATILSQDEIDWLIGEQSP